MKVKVVVTGRVFNDIIDSWKWK